MFDLAYRHVSRNRNVGADSFSPVLLREHRLDQICFLLQFVSITPHPDAKAWYRRRVQRLARGMKKKKNGDRARMPPKESSFPVVMDPENPSRTSAFPPISPTRFMPLFK